MASLRHTTRPSADPRLDGYLDGVFWVSVIGLAIIVGGAIVLKQVGFGDLVILIYTVLSSIIFLINLALNLWSSVSLLRRAKERNASIQQTPETAELNPARPEAFLTPAHSVTENTTRSFEPVPRVNRSGSE